MLSKGACRAYGDVAKVCGRHLAAKSRLLGVAGRIEVATKVEDAGEGGRCDTGAAKHQPPGEALAVGAAGGGGLKVVRR